MDDLQAQLGAAISHLHAALPDPNYFSGPAADALTRAIEEVVTEVGGLAFGALRLLEPLVAEVLPLG